MNCNSKRKSVLVILGTAHGIEVTPGKCSPDGVFKEYRWSRMMCKRLLKRLQDDGYRAIIDHEGLNEIGLSNRAQIVNNYCSVFGKKNVVYVSIHNNAAGSDGKWKKARNWSIFVAPNASENSKKLASYICQEIENQGLDVRRYLPKQDWWPGNFTVLTRTLSPAVLSENLFMDNRADLEIIMSKEGQDKILEAHALGIERYVDELVGITTEKTS